MKRREETGKYMVVHSTFNSKAEAYKGSDQKKARTDQVHSKNN